MIPVNIPLITEGDISSVIKALRDGWISGEGPVVSGFEEAVASSLGRKFGISVSNGSDAIELALQVLDLNPGDEIILPSFTIVSCLAPILRFGLVPVFVDVQPETWNLNPQQLESALSPATKAILVVHTYGLAADMDKIEAFAKLHNLKVIEDSAEAQGMSYKGRKCGSMGDLSTLSFYANKNLTTGEGGMVLTDNPILAEKLRYFRNLTFRPERRFVHDDVGWNMRLSSLQAALGASQLARVEESLQRRRVIAKKYLEVLSSKSGLSFQALEANGEENGYWVVGVVLDKHPRFKVATDAMSALAEAGVATRPFFFPLHDQPLFSKGFKYRVAGDMSVSSRLGDMGFYLPNGLGMSDEMLDQAVEISGRIL
jgi:perosamine synthetase